jgi:hypothetical protein
VAVLLIVIRNICCYALECWQLHGKKKKYKQTLHCRYNFDILYIFCFPAKIIFFKFMYVFYDALSLGNRHSTFRNTLLISYSNVENIMNISLKEVVSAITFRYIDNKLPNVIASHLSSKNTECSWSHPELNWRSWGTRDLERIETNDFKLVLGKEYDYLWFVWTCILIWNDVCDQMDANAMTYY